MTTKERRRVVLPLDIDHDRFCENKGTGTASPSSYIIDRSRFTSYGKVPSRKCPGCTYLRGYEDGSMQKQLELPLGIARKRQAHARFEDVAKDWLAEARAYARRKCQETGSVTTDDIIQAIGKPPEGISSNAIGAIWSSGEFRPIGWTHSTRPTNNGRAIRRWSLR